MFERMLADVELSEDLVDTIALEARRRAPEMVRAQSGESPLIGSLRYG